LQLLEQEIDGVALFLEVQLLQNHVQLCIYSQLFRIWLHSIVVSVICSWLLMPPSFFFPHLLGVKAFMEKMVQITSFASKAEGSGVSVLCVYFHGESTCLQLHLPVSAH